MITIFVMAYNEELVLQFMIDHYRSRFPDCHIVLYDNQSTDNTVTIAQKNNCEIRKYNTNDEQNDELLKNHKNNCWKTAPTNWILVCDPDEIIDINMEDLKREDALGTTIIRSEAYNMINHEDNIDIGSILCGVRDTMYDKYYAFNKSAIKEINYVHGAHLCHPVGQIKFSEHPYKAYHYKYINLKLLLERVKISAKRLSAINKAHGWGIQNMQSDEQITEYWNHLKNISVKIR